MTDAPKSSISVIKDFLQDDPNPPNSKELMAFFKSIPLAERVVMAKRIDPNWVAQS